MGMRPAKWTQILSQTRQVLRHWFEGVNLARVANQAGSERRDQDVVDQETIGKEAVMAESPSKDPAAAWRDLVTQWEKNLNELANRTMGSDEFAKSVNQAVGLSAGMQSSLSEAMGRYLASLLD